MKTREPAVTVETINDARVQVAIGGTSREISHRDASELAAQIQAAADAARRGAPSSSELRAMRHQIQARHHSERASVRINLGPYFADLDAAIARRLADNLHDAADALEAQQPEQQEPAA